MGATLAAGGVNPVNKERVIAADHTAPSLMLTICAASEWLIGHEERRPPSNSSMQE
jgi:hypothetical protein